MRSTTSRRWSERDDKYLKENIANGVQKLSEYFGVSDTALRKRCSIIGISSSTRIKVDSAEKKTKADNSEKFNPKTHKIKNNSIEGLIPFYIKPEKMTVYLEPHKATKKHKDAIIIKFANRHKPII